MKHLLFLFSALIIFNISSQAQAKQYRIVFDMAGADTADHNTIIRQVNNVLKFSPQAQVEVVFHGKALYALVKDKTTVKEKIDDLVNNKHVVIAACHNSMMRLGIAKEDLLTSATVVPIAMLEIANKEMEGWSYIKAGH